MNTIVEVIARDLAFFLKKDLKEPIHLRITLSQERGVEIDDPRYSEIFHQNVKGMGMAVPTSQLAAAGFGHLRRVEVADAQRAQYESQIGQPCTVLDPMSFMLFQGGVSAPETIELSLSGFHAKGKGGGLTTASFRFPHMYLDMYERIQNRKREDLKDCIVGPGLQRPGGKLGYCSQFVELKALFPNAEFLLLDKDKEALECLEGQYKKIRAAAYDPLVARMLTLDMEKSPFLAPKEFQPMLAEMKAEMAACAKFPSNAKEMLDGFGQIKNMMLEVDPNKIEVREFDINTTEFESEDKFDVMVATMSVLLALAESASRKEVLDVMLKHLDRLNVEGYLYIDAQLMQALLMPALDCETPEEVMALLSERNGSEYVINRIGLERYLPDTTGDSGTLPNPSIFAATKGNEEVISTSTHSVYVITNKGARASVGAKSIINSV